MLTLDGLTKRYPIADGELTVLDDVTFTFPTGGSVAIMGRSGIGKSTLLHLLGGLDAPTSGRVLYGDTDVTSLGDEERARFRGNHIGFVFQFHHLLPEFTALENVAMPLVIGGKCKAEAREKAVMFLERVDLRNRLEHLPGQLSGGEQQRVALARAVVGEPDVILADEPTGNLDSSSAQQVKELLLELNREGSNTLVTVTHSEELAGEMKTVVEMRDNGLLEIRA